MPDPTPATITVELTPNEAWYFAQFLKRASHSTFARCSDPTDKVEPDQMLAAASKLQRAFAAAGYAPR
jgi:hypothetical protein